MAFAATPPRSPFKRYLVSAIYTETMTPFRPTKNHNFILSISLWPQSWNVHHKAVFKWAFYPAASDVEDRVICSHPKGLWRALRWLTSLSTLTPAAIGLGELGQSIRTIKTNMNEFTQGYQQSRTSSAAFWPTEHVEYASGSRWDRSLWLVVQLSEPVYEKSSESDASWSLAVVFGVCSSATFWARSMQLFVRHLHY